MSGDLVSSIEDILSCPVCLEIPESTSPIYQCIFGHLVCHGCFNSLSNKCPICRGPLDDKNRNNIAEQMVKTLRTFNFRKNNNNNRHNNSLSGVKSDYNKNEAGETPRPNPRNKARALSAKVQPSAETGGGNDLQDGEGAHSLPADVNDGEQEEIEDSSVEVQKAIESSIRSELIANNDLDYAISVSKEFYEEEERKEREELENKIISAVIAISNQEK